MKTKNNIILKTIGVIYAGFIIFIIFNYAIGGKYSPTIEAAFSGYSSGEKGMGEILFIDEHENNLSIVHEKTSAKGTSLFTSHYFKKEKNDRDVYLCVGVARRELMLNTDLESSKNPQMKMVSSQSTRKFKHKLLGRTPEDGISRDKKIYGLMIDEQLVDKVIEVQSSNGSIYYWYFSDLVIRDFENITISFK